MPLPPVLEYARHHGIARDFDQTFQQDLAEAIKQIAGTTDDSDNPPPPNAASVLLSTPILDHWEVAREDKIALTIKQAQILQNAVSAPSIELKPDSVDAWKTLLPDDTRTRDLYIDEPLLWIGGGNIERDIGLVRKGSDIDSSIRDTYNRRDGEDDTTNSNASNPQSTLQTIFKATELLAGDLGKEHMEASEGALRAINTLHSDHHDRKWTECVLQKEIELTRLFRHDSPLPELEPMMPPLRRDLSTSPVEGGQSAYFSQEATRSASITHNRRATDVRNALNVARIHVGSPKRLIACPLSSVLDVCERKRRKLSSGDETRLPLGHRNSPETAHIAMKPNTTHEKTHSSGIILSQASQEVCTASKHQQETSSPHERPIAQIEYEYPKADKPSALLHTRLSEDKPAISGLRTLFAVRKEVLLKEMLDEEMFKAQYEEQVEPILPHDFISEVAGSIIDESMAGKDTFMQTLDNSKPLIDSSQMLWKTPGTKILQEAESDEEDRSQNWASYSRCDDREYHLARGSCHKSLLPFDQTPIMQTESSMQQAMVEGCLPRSQRKWVARPAIHSQSKKVIARPVSKQNYILPLKSSLSMSSSLASFLSLRGKTISTAKRAAHVLMPDLSNVSNPSTPSQSKGDGTTSNPTCQESLELDGIRAAMHEDITPFLPVCQPLTHHRSIIVNNNLLQSHLDLLTYCDGCGGPMLSIIYRDFTSIDDASPDMILDSATCLLITNMQLLKQRSLPGRRMETNSQLPRARISMLSRLFSRVIVLIAQQAISEADRTATTELTAYFSSIQSPTQGKIKPVYISCVTAAELSDSLKAWTWISIKTYAYPRSVPNCDLLRSRSAPLSEDESVWELFLRKAGLNAMAAQIVLSVLHSSDTYDGPSGLHKQGLNGKSALGRFVNMNLNERISELRDVVGHWHISRISSSIDLCTSNDR